MEVEVTVSRDRAEEATEQVSVSKNKIFQVNETQSLHIKPVQTYYFSLTFTLINPIFLCPPNLTIALIRTLLVSFGITVHEGLHVKESQKCYLLTI